MNAAVVRFIFSDLYYTHFCIKRAIMTHLRGLNPQLFDPLDLSTKIT